MILPISSILRRCARWLSIFIAVACAGGEALGGSYSQNFNAAAVGGTTLGDGSTISASAGTITTSVQQVTAGDNALQMMTAGWGSASASYKLPNLDSTKPIQSFDAIGTVGQLVGRSLPICQEDQMALCRFSGNIRIVSGEQAGRGEQASAPDHADVMIGIAPNYQTIDIGGDVCRIHFCQFLRR